MRTRAPLALVALVAVACADTDRAESEAEPAVDSVAIAAAAFEAAVFDTITWETPAEAVDRGGVVFSYSCAKCHGIKGFGDAGFVQDGDTLRPPSFHQSGWRFAGDLDGLRKMVFTGGQTHMPHWGLVGLGYRDVDAVSRYILEMRGGGVTDAP